jgi:hypothetical protein
MTAAQAQAQRDGLESGSFADFLRPILESFKAEDAKGKDDQYRNEVNDLFDHMTALGTVHLADYADVPLTESAEQLAATTMFRLTHKELAIAFANVSIRLAEIEAEDPDDDLDDVDPVEAAAVRAADMTDEADDAMQRVFAEVLAESIAEDTAKGKAPGLYL